MTLNPVAAAARMWNALRVRLALPQRMGGFIGPNAAGQVVTHDRAMQVAAVWACMDVIASTAAASDWNVYGGVRNASNKQDLPNDALQYILNTRMNPEMTAQAGKRAMMLFAVGWGTGYAEIERDLSGRIVNLWPIAANRVDPRRDTDTGRLFYRVTQEWNGGTVDMDPSDLFVIRGAGLLGFAGDDSIARAVKSIAMALALDTFSASYFANGAQLGLIVEYTGKLDDPAFDRMKAQLAGKHGGAGNAFKSLLIENGGKVTQTSSDGEKAQMIPAKEASVEEICRWFRVPPHKVAHLLRATNNNIEHQGLEFTRDTMRPWIKEIEQESDYKLIAYRGPPKFVEIDVDWAEQGDYKSRAEAYQILRGCGVFTVDDVLRKLGENTIGTKKGGDLRTLNGASVRLEDVGKNMLPAPAPAPAKPAAPAPAPAADMTAAWLTSIYSRIQRRVDNRSERLRKEGRPDWADEARSTTKTFALELVADMADALGEHLTAANEWALQVINGTDPHIAAQAALGRT